VGPNRMGTRTVRHERTTGCEVGVWRGSLAVFEGRFGSLDRAGTVVIIRNPNRERYVILAKTALEDKKLSFKAKGLWAYLMTKPDNWVVYVDQLVRVGPDGKRAVVSALKELAEAGYVRRDTGAARTRSPTGTWNATTTEVFESPHPMVQDAKHAVATRRENTEDAGQSHSTFSKVDSAPLVTNEEAKNELTDPLCDAESSRERVACSIENWRAVRDAIAKACDIDVSLLPPSQRGKDGALNRATSDVCEVGATPERIWEFAGWWGTTWTQMTLTPMCFSKYWAKAFKRCDSASG